MSHLIRTWLLWLTLLGVLLTHLLGDYAATWSEGGEGGTVNLPGAATRSTLGTLTPRRSGDGGTYRVGYQMEDLAQGLTLNLPSNMDTCTATLTIGEAAAVTGVYAGAMAISGSELLESRACGQLEISVILATSTKLLNVLILLDADESSFQVLVE